jgi:hypothetical protein
MFEPTMFQCDVTFRLRLQASARMGQCSAHLFKQLAPLEMQFLMPLDTLACEASIVFAAVAHAHPVT